MQQGRIFGATTGARVGRDCSPPLPTRAARFSCSVRVFIARPRDARRPSHDNLREVLLFLTV
jgi:hypothetical protein